MPDFRSDPMASAEGKGLARRAWDSYVKNTNKYLGPTFSPLLEPAAKKIGATVTADIFGFWLMWQLEGGFEGCQRMGMSRSAIYRRIKVFRGLTGFHPDEYVMPGVAIDVAAYLAAGRSKREK